MEGMTRSQVDKAELRDSALGAGPKRPRDAATLMLLDRKGNDVLVLMGRRHSSLAFMPGKLVFPGGKTDPDDSRVSVIDSLPAQDEARLIATTARTSATRARAIALSAIRETYEEAGLLIGRKMPFTTTKPDWQGFAEHGVQPELAPLRFIARAITPPGRVRRFDTRFLSAWRSSVALELPDGGPTNELEELVWLPLAEAQAADVPAITHTILEELRQRLAHDPDLEPGGAIPFYHMVRNRFVRDLL